MKCTFKLTIGAVLFVFFVFKPIKANLLASAATKYGLDLNGQAQLLEQAHLVAPCNFAIANKLGDTYLQSKNYLSATIAYGQAITCSPGMAELRFKYGEMLLAQGHIEGRDNVREALMLEPNNPIFKAELERLTKFQ